MQLLMNIVFFKIGWLSSVVGGANDMPWLGPLAVFVAVVLHLSVSHRPASELALILTCGLIGAAFDSALVSFGWVSYASGVFSEGLAPYWIITMWMLLGTTLNRSMRWLQGKPLLAAAIGAVSGPLAYVGGAKIGGIQFVDQAAALVMLSVGWAIVLPVLMYLASCLDGVAPKEPSMATA